MPRRASRRPWCRPELRSGFARALWLVDLALRARAHFVQRGFAGAGAGDGFDFVPGGDAHFVEVGFVDFAAAAARAAAGSGTRGVPLTPALSLKGRGGRGAGAPGLPLTPAPRSSRGQAL